MVEFMPKPELAKMAEALVNLTSIKRRVSSAFFAQVASYPAAAKKFVHS
jgi:hypothetical protein